MAERHLVIVGGGITGLSAAYAAAARARETGQALEITVLERQLRFGGNLVTERIDGFLLDGGPDSWVSTKPHASALARELGLGEELIATNESTRRYYIVRGGRLHAVPDGLILGVPTRLGPLLRTSLFSWRGKARMAMEPLVARRQFASEDDDESIAAFARRRLGREAAERLVAPLLGGISAADAADVSVRAAFPQLVAMEQEYGSLVRGMRAAVRKRASPSGKSQSESEHKGKGKGSGKDPGAFVTLEGGVGDLTSRLVERLRAGGATMRPGAAVRTVARHAGSWTLDLDGGVQIAADAVILAVPAHAAARVVAALDGDLARQLASVAYTSTATVFLAYRRADVAHPLDGVGFVVPRASGLSILAATWVSSKWKGRAPDGRVLLRVFFGGEGAGTVLGRDDGGLTALAVDELGALVGLDARPLWSRVFRFDGARALMRVGHLAAMRAMRERLARVAPGLRIAGDGYDGGGIPDCVRQGEEAGRGLVDPACV